jgi:hypothetical protein
MVTMLALRVVDRGFDTWSGQTKDYYTGFPVPFNECIYQLLNEY